MAAVNPGGQAAAAGLSEAAQAELLDVCQDQFALLEEVHNEIMLREPESCENPQELAQNQLIATETELKQWLTMEPNLLIENAEILLQAGKEEMLKLCSELELVVSCYEAKRDKLKETKELERKWLEEKTQVLLAVSDHIERLQKEKETLSEHSLLQDMKAKMAKMKCYHERLMECLGDILGKHVPLPQDDLSSNKKKKSSEVELNEDLISLAEILEGELRFLTTLQELMNKMLNTPHDPYVLINERFWPPYVEMLLRYGIAVRHQDNNFKIRLETFV